MKISLNRYIFFALLAAILFGASAPLNKLYLASIEPIAMASFLYLGSGMMMAAIKGLQSLKILRRENQGKWEKNEIPFLAGAILSGGVAAPILLLFSLRTTPASTSSLLLNFEVAATSLIAVFLFREKINRQVVYTILFVTAASILLSLEGQGQWGFSIGALGILGACFLWGFDNNFTKKIASKDAITIVFIKGLSAGVFSFILSRLAGEPLPAVNMALTAMMIGAVCYGLSILLFILAMRGLGAARTSALFGTSPVAGVLISFILFNEAINVKFVAAFLFVLTGILLLSNEKHTHIHAHERMTHTHLHRHDDGHHDHQHSNHGASQFLHSHPHSHEPIIHEHEHTHTGDHKHGQ